MGLVTEKVLLRTKNILSDPESYLTYHSLSNLGRGLE